MARLVTERADVLPVLAELFREHGFDGASLSLIGERTGLGKGSLYHFFPGGKEEMATAVLAEIEIWFERSVFAPLRNEHNPRSGITRMFDAVDAYFQSGRRICLVGAFALDGTRDYFAQAIRKYFDTWTVTLAQALMRRGMAKPRARDLAEETVAAIQGALVLGRALQDATVFSRALKRLKNRLTSE